MVLDTDSTKGGWNIEVKTNISTNIRSGYNEDLKVVLRLWCIQIWNRGHSVTCFWKPVTYAAVLLNQSEVNYSQLDKEAFAIIFAVKKFNQF